VDITNTGKTAGKEIIQLYVRDVKATVARPEKELKAFAKVELAPGQTRTVTLTLDREAFWYFNVVKNAWEVEAGEFEILIGASSRDIRLNGSVTLTPELRASRLHTGLTLKTLLDDPQGRAVISKYAGGFLLMGDMSMALDMTLEQIASNHPTFVTASLLAQIGEELAKV
jgi:beta-glucosidase